MRIPWRRFSARFRWSVHLSGKTFDSDAAIICNEEGRLQRLPYNCTLLGMDFFGTVLIAGVKGDEFASVRGRSIPMLMCLFGK